MKTHTLQDKGEVFCDYLVPLHPETNFSGVQHRSPALANKLTNQHTLQHLQ